MTKRKITLILLTPFILFALFWGGGYTWCEVNDQLRIRDAEPAFRPIESLGCTILSNPHCSRYCSYMVIFPQESLLSNNNVSTLSSLNKLPAENYLDIVIETNQLTDDAISQLIAIQTIDILEVTKSGISDAGIEHLAKELPQTQVNRRKKKN